MRRQSGMTLIELVVALAIAAMLAVAAMGIVVNLARSESAEGRIRSQRDAESGMRKVVAGDIQHADGFRTIPEGVELRTRSALDPETLEAGHLESSVRYKVVAVGSDTWLIREQESEIAGALTELMCKGASAVRLVPLAGDNGTTSAGLMPVARPAPVVSTRGSGEWKPMPPAVLFVVEFGGEGTDAVEYRFSRGW